MNMKSPFPKAGVGDEKGFTLIELIMVIVLLGILAAVAIPRYQDIRQEAAEAACDGVFGAAQGAAAVNFATRLVSPTGGTVIDDGGALIAALEGGAPAGWSTGAGTTDVLFKTFGAVHCSISIATPQGASTMASFRKDFN